MDALNEGFNFAADIGSTDIMFKNRRDGVKIEASQTNFGADDFVVMDIHEDDALEFLVRLRLWADEAIAKRLKG